MNTYELEIRARCPIDPALVDIYNARIESYEIIEVERILAAFGKYTNTVIFQEKLTKLVSGELGVRVELVGVHSGVKTTSVFP